MRRGYEPPALPLPFCCGAQPYQMTGLWPARLAADADESDCRAAQCLHLGSSMPQLERRAVASSLCDSIIATPARDCVEHL